MVQNAGETKSSAQANNQLFMKGHPSTTVKHEQRLTAAMIQSLLQQSEEIIELQANDDAEETSFSSNYFADQLDYMTLLSALNIEFRYGKGAQQHGIVEYVMHLFDEYMANLTYRFKLEQLKGHNSIAFYAAIDVFTLCTMFAKHEKMPQLHDIAIGFLFHNIGQLDEKHTASEQLFYEMGLDKVAHLGKPYSKQVEAQVEVKLLHIVQTYVHLTMQQAMHPADAITHMYADIDLKADYLLQAFSHFLGIFPANAVVLLSDGSQAVIENKGIANPLLPQVRSLQTGALFYLPYDFKLHISKMVAPSAMSFEYLFTNLSEAICNAQYTIVKQYFERLISLYEASKWYTHIHIPLFKIISILDTNDVLLPEKREKMKDMYRHMMKETKIKLNAQMTQSEIVLMLVEEDFEQQELIHLLEGLLCLDGMYPIVIRNEKSAREITDMIERLNIQQVFVVNAQKTRTLSHNTAAVFHFDEQELERLLMAFSYKSLQGGDVRRCLQQVSETIGYVSDQSLHFSKN